MHFFSFFYRELENHGSFEKQKKILRLIMNLLIFLCAVYLLIYLGKGIRFYIIKFNIISNKNIFANKKFIEDIRKLSHTQI